MSAALLALIASVLGVVPLIAGRKLLVAAITAACSWVVLTIAFYLGVPSLVWPWWGEVGVSVWILLIISAGIDIGITNSKCQYNESLYFWTAVFPVLLTLVWIGSWFARESYFINAQAYSDLIGEVEERVWTQDVQPKDPRHIRMSSAENAAQLARQTLGQAGSIGSQFEVDGSRMTLQKISNEFWWIVPLDFKEWATWRATRTVPAYVRVSAEDPTLPGQIVFLDKDQQLRYTPGAYWEFNLTRHLWYSGYHNKGLTDENLEIDDNGKAWLIVTVFHPTLFGDGAKVDGVVIVDPVNGDDTFCPVGKVPEWIDRVFPYRFVSNYIWWKGMLHNGWGNAYWLTGAGKDLTVPETPNLIYGSDGYLTWATGITSSNTNDTSLVGIYYTHSRTGETVFYKAKGSTDEAVTAAVNKDDKVQFKQLHGADAQLYNINGTMASVVPLLNENHLFQGVAIVNIENIQIVGVGTDQFEALREYQKALPLSGHQIAPEFKRDIKEIKGIVDRRADVVQGGEVVIYLHIQGVPHLFIGSPKLSVELPMTHEGDTILLSYYASGEQVEPMNSFDNLSLQLESTQAEDQVRSSVLGNKAEFQKKKDAGDARELLKNLSQEELLQLQQELKRKKSVQ